MRFAPASLLMCMILFSALGSTATAEPTAKLPNILVILADDLGYGDVGCYSDEAKAPTPNIDKPPPLFLG